jgi:hypothetical protein
VALAIAHRLNTTLAAGEREAIERRHTSNLVAYDPGAMPDA